MSSVPHSTAHSPQPTATDPYGATRSLRTLALTSEAPYRHAFQGTRLLEGAGGLAEYRTPFRLYDGRTGRWAGLDPVQQPWTSPYEGLNSAPIRTVDLLGLDGTSSPLEPAGGNGGFWSAITGFFSDIGNAIGNAWNSAGSFFTTSIGSFGSASGTLVASGGVLDQIHRDLDGPVEPAFSTLGRFEPLEGAAGYATAVPNAVNNFFIDLANAPAYLGNAAQSAYDQIDNYGFVGYTQRVTALVLTDLNNTPTLEGLGAQLVSPAGIQQFVETGLGVGLGARFALGKQPKTAPRLVAGAEDAGKGALGRAVAEATPVSASRQPIYSAKVLEDMAADKFHNFPASFERSILSQSPFVGPDGRMEFLMRGSINGTDGVFYITTRNGGTVMSHRAFIPESDWSRFAARWDLPRLNEIAR